MYQFKSMISSVILQSLIILMEVMGVVNLDVGGAPIPWSAVFGPAYLLMIVSIPSCIWGCYRKQGIEVWSDSVIITHTLLLATFLLSSD